MKQSRGIKFIIPNIWRVGKVTSVVCFCYFCYFFLRGQNLLPQLLWSPFNSQNIERIHITLTSFIPIRPFHIGNCYLHVELVDGPSDVSWILLLWAFRFRFTLVYINHSELLHESKGRWIDVMMNCETQIADWFLFHFYALLYGDR